MLNAAVVSALPTAKPVEPVPIVRPLARRPDGFDPRELVGAGAVLTVPLVLAVSLSDARRTRVREVRVAREN